MIYFMASIARSGSTLLASLLEQRPDTYVSSTSNLGELLGSVVQNWYDNPATEASNCTQVELHRILKAMVVAKYSERNEAVIIDKGRIWPDKDNIETMQKVLGDPLKIIATVRPMVECIASFYLIDSAYRKKNQDMDIKTWIKESPLMKALTDGYHAIKNGYEAYPENFCFVEYDNLCDNPQKELDRIADFIGVEKFKYNPHIEQIDEDDSAWDIINLHKLRSSIKKIKHDTKQILGDRIFEKYQGGEFWNDTPEPIKEKMNKLDYQLEAGLKGDFITGQRLADEMEKEIPDCNRAKFNRGWYELRKGNLLEGHKCLDAGRFENVFGNRHIGSSQPIWIGEKNVTVLLNLEGGLGDQIHGVRFAKNIADYGNKVVVSCSSELAELFIDCEGVSAVVQDKACLGVYHNFWLPSMSAVVPLNLEYKDLCGKPYIKRTRASEGLSLIHI